MTHATSFEQRPTSASTAWSSGIVTDVERPRRARPGRDRAALVRDRLPRVGPGRASSTPAPATAAPGCRRSTARCSWCSPTATCAGRSSSAACTARSTSRPSRARVSATSARCARPTARSSASTRPTQIVTLKTQTGAIVRLEEKTRRAHAQGHFEDQPQGRRDLHRGHRIGDGQGIDHRAQLTQVKQ